MFCTGIEAQTVDFRIGDNVIFRKTILGFASEKELCRLAVSARFVAEEEAVPRCAADAVCRKCHAAGVVMKMTVFHENVSCPDRPDCHRQ